MLISNKEIEETAKLAKLALSDEQLNTLGDQLQEILEFAQVLGDLPLAHIQPMAGVYRENGNGTEDKARLSQAQVLALAPDSRQGMIRVPRVMDQC